MKKFLFIPVLALACLSCSKEEGLGGKVNIQGNVEHHEVAIPDATVYIKFGAREFPGEDISIYDHAVQADANAYFEIKELQKGYYYLYGVGFDKAISQEVKGGIPILLKKNKTETVDVPVTED